MDRPPQALRRTDGTRLGVIVFLAALAVRWLHVFSLRTAPFWDLLIGDAATYDAWARRIAGGDGLGPETFYQAPLYPYLLGLWYRLAGPDLLAVRLLQGVMGAAGCAFVAAATARFAGRTAGWAAGVLLAGYAPAIFLGALVQKSALDLLLVAALVLAVAHLVERPERWRFFATGALFGLLVLNRENSLLVAPVFAGWVLWRFRPRFRLAAWWLAGVAIALAPAVAHNAWVGGEFLVTTAQFGPNLYIGNHPGATGSYVPLRPGRGDASFERRDAVEIAEAATGRSLTSSEVSNYWRDRAWDWIRTDPAAFVRLLGRKLGLAWSGSEAMDTEDQATHAEYSPILRVSSPVFHFALVAPLALLGIWWARPRWPDVGVLAAMALTYTASLVLFYVVARYRLPLVPLVAPFAGLALAEAPARWREATPASRVATVAALFAVAVPIALPRFSEPSYGAITHLNYAQALRVKGRTAEARSEYLRVLAADASNPVAHANLGVLAAESGDREAALRHFLAAVESAPEEARNQQNLGVEFARQGRVREALSPFARAAALAPSDAALRFDFAATLAAAGESERAVAEFEAALRLDPTNALAENNLGILLAGRGDLAAAAVHFEAAVRLRPDFQAAAENLARARSRF